MNANNIIPLTQGIKYAGSKLKLLPYILDMIKPLGVSSVLDGFSGSTRVSQALAQSGYTVTANDIAPWSKVFGGCYLKSAKPDAFYQKYLDILNGLEGKAGWFSANYGGEPGETKKPFQIKNMLRLDAIRPAIDGFNLAEQDKAVLLASLILALDKVDSTLGHFSSYLNKWSARSYGDLKLVLPQRFKHKGGHEVSCKDIFDVVGADSWDLAYFDPPYGSNNAKMPPSRVRYNAYYHFWTSVINNDEPKLFGRACRREDSRDNARYNPFEDYKGDANGSFAMQAVGKLLKQTNARYILLSYSSGGRATWQELQAVISQNGRLIKTMQIDYKQNVMALMQSTGKWLQDNPAPHKEYLLLMEKDI